MVEMWLGECERKISDSERTLEGLDRHDKKMKKEKPRLSFSRLLPEC